MTEPPPAGITTYLRTVTYPADREALIDAAEQGRAPDDVLTIVRRLDDQTYGGVAEVAEAVDGVLVRLGRRAREDLVGEASRESFPASDSPAYANWSHIGRPPGRRR